MAVEKRRRLQLFVIGFAADHCSEEARTLGARSGLTQQCGVTGGLGGIMEAAWKAVKENYGVTVGIVPQDENHHANPHCDIAIATGIGCARNFITAYSAVDAVVMIAGGAGANTRALS